MPEPHTADDRFDAFDDLDELCVSTIRTLAIDAVQAANSGHPGAPMALAPAAHTLWHRFLRYDPADPLWPNRDRFVLSGGHGSALLYALLHLAQVREVATDGTVLQRPAVALEDLQRFRQLDSRCAGHPEYGLTTGVEATTGPLGTGVASAVGMAIAARWLGARYNRTRYQLFDYDTYAMCGDGDLMEGIAAEAASLAGHLKLSNLCWIYDSNQISIEGSTSLAFTEDVAARFLAYGWYVTRVSDANDRNQVARALESFHAERSRPTLIIAESSIGYGAPTKQGTAAAHGQPLGEAEVAGAKRCYGWPEDARFLVPHEAYAHVSDGITKRGRAQRRAWDEKLQQYAEEYPELADELCLIRRSELPADWARDLPAFPADAKGLATRASSGQVLNAVACNVPWMLGGSADLAPSTKTTLTFDGAGAFAANQPQGRNLHFGVREFTAAAVTNGLALSGLRAYWSTFLVFSDFARGALRLSALMKLPVVHIFTHDSIAVGEDGPTHQPIEHLASLRAMPGLDVFRPCDANEVAETWRVIMGQTRRPAALALTRQALPTLDRTAYASASGLARGGYVLADPAEGAPPEVLLIATGSEVHLALEAFQKLSADSIRVRLVSLPCWELFERQPATYRDEVLPPSISARVAVELGSPFGWERYVGRDGAVIGLDTFGESAPKSALFDEFGITADAVAKAARAQLASAG
ncbi:MULTISPECIES: transketolase [unclassified Streptomyces]|uniref:transketolase n=1 Tax=unclassified Streptomyces TaxID=2593676 RepID=UPI000F6D8466|nr:MULTISPECIES: transketolase [unclassified Streptomyces]AZM58481.1 transketolase [Streptomyces sp. WAC 01438]RSM88991.1 transketolase [Streptomyces sp. WAC 01420]